MAIGITLVVLALAWYGLELLRHRTRARPGGIDRSTTLPHERAWELYHNSFSLCSKKTRVCLDELEGALEESGGPWIAGSRFSLADVGMMAILDRLREVDWLDTFLTQARPRVAAYWNALQARPSYAAAIGAFEHPTVVRGLDRVRHLKETDAAFHAALTG